MLDYIINQRPAMKNAEKRVVAVVNVGQSSQVGVWNSDLTIKTP